MKILSIGNSFSHNAQTYLYQLAYADRFPMKTANLYIGGCSLETHYNNMKSGAKANPFYLNGNESGFMVSIEEALRSDSWDFVTLQQASHFSGEYETYFPYIDELAKFVRKKCPRAEILIHQTWAYEEGSQRLKDLLKFASSKEEKCILLIFVTPKTNFATSLPNLFSISSIV